MSLSDRLDKEINRFFDIAIGPRSIDYAIDAHGIIAVVDEVQRKRGAKLTSIDMNPALQYNEEERALHLKCEPGPGEYDRRNPTRTEYEGICALVEYNLHFNDGRAERIFLHSPVKLSAENERAHEELIRYVAEQEVILKNANLSVRTGNLKKYYAAEWVSEDKRRYELPSAATKPQTLSSA